MLDETTGKEKDILGGHVIHAYRDNGKICLYDPQSSWGFQGKDEILYFLEQQKVEYKYHEATPGMLRVDNLDVNVTLVEKVLREATR